MEADWDELTRIPFPPPGPHALQTPVTVFAFDTSQELLWVGNEYGRVSSFYGAELQKYTSYKGHPSPEQVKQILCCDKGVLSVSPKSIHFALRRGLTQWHLSNPEFKDLRSMSFASKGTSELLVAGCQDTMFKIDVEKGTIAQTLPAEDKYTMLKRGGHYICAATATGAVHLIDPSSYQVVKVWRTAHAGGIIDMDAKSDFLVTCGCSPRAQMGLMPDPLANVFDLKTLVPLPPIPFQPGAAFVRMHPRMSTTGIVASYSGQMQVVDIMNPNSIVLRQANVYDTQILSLELAPSGDALAITDGFCSIHLWGSPARMHFTEYSNPTEFPDHVLPPPSLEMSSDTPLSTVGLPYYRETLLSAWPSHMIFEVGAPPPKIDPSVQANLKRGDMGGYTTNPRKTRRNQIEDSRVARGMHEALVAPKFLSEKAREASQDGERRMSDVFNAIEDMMLDGSTKRDVPVMYRNVEIKYSKFGVDDFDFEYYNKTKFSGLETHIANSYANPLLQLYRFIPLIRNLSLNHAATSCLFENCLLCEMGFLIDMLEKAEGQNCQATNFLKTFSSSSHAASLGLLEEHQPSSALTVMIQAVNRFLLDKLAADFRHMSPQASHMDQALTTLAMTTIRCAHCTSELQRPGPTYVHELVYPAKVAKGGHGRSSRPTFSQILKASVERHDQTRGWCDRCKRYQQLHTRKTTQSVPAVLMINAAITNSEAKQIWATPNWLPQEIGIIVDQGQFFCYEGQDLKLHVQRGVFNIRVYSLIGIVADINSGEHQKPHLVSLVDVAPSSRDVSENNNFHLFNDFLVRPTSTPEALSFNSGWKLPSVLAYQLKSTNHAIDDTWKSNLDPSLLYRRWSASQEADPTKFQLLNPQHEAPAPGTLVAIDAEFVSLQREEIEIKADGSRETIRPSRLGLARVSVLRGDGGSSPSTPNLNPTQTSDSITNSPSTTPDPALARITTTTTTTTNNRSGIPFIDDYIAIPEPIIDYLTLFSGIHPGDLDRSSSRHTLVSLKVAYKKLWLLLNLGCVFVGHGLPKDFRTINIHVPKRQVVDTVDLFHLRRYQRKLNLRFLAWLLLGEEIQTDVRAGHDSVEDARTALRLWERYRVYEERGPEAVEDMLEWVYARGREVGFRAPGAAAALQAAAVGAGAAGIAGNSRPQTRQGNRAGGTETPDLTLGSLTPGRAEVPFGQVLAGRGFGFGGAGAGAGGSPMR